MTGRDETGADVLTFPRVGLPAFLHNDPEPTPATAEGDADAEVPPAPRVPNAQEMTPPLHLTMPAISLPGDGDVEDDEGEFAPPDYDPDHPTAGDTVAVGLALMTALGIAGARGMWQAGASWRARAAHKRALAEKAQAEADKAHAAAKPAPTATATRSNGTAAKGTSSGSKSGGDSKGLLGSPAATKRKTGGDGRTGGVSSPKAGRRGGTDASSTGSPSGKRRFWKKDRDQDAQDGGSKQQKKTADGKTPGKKKTDGTKTADAKAGGAKTDGAKTADAKTADAKADGAKEDGKKAADAKASGAKTADAKADGAKADGAEKTDDAKTGTKADGAKAEEREPEVKGSEGEVVEAVWEEAEQEKPQERGERQTPSVPGLPTWQDMRPPQRADTTVQTTVERLDQDQPQRRDAVGEVLSATASASASPSEGETVTVMPMGRPNTQYTDAELTIYDVIDADADMAGEIIDGVTEATRSAEACDRLFSKLEVLHAEIVDLKVPGVLEGMVVSLMDKVITVKARAQAIAEKLPAAAESISTAGTNAATRHQGLADAVRDAGHARPAERDYHNE